jgi:CDP-glycerol glycerophosphotransferase (TagB/SpsB family)
MKKFNYTGIFCLHPSFSSQYIDFTENNLFSIKNKCNYQDILLKASLLITDYSSIFFDFAYLKKPVIYAHFDYEEYRLNHCPEGYFDYEKDGFGSITYDLKTTVDAIINEIENNCLLKEIYLRRINNFFTYFDELNNDRLYKEILKNTKITKSLREPISYILFVLAMLINAKLIIIFKNILLREFKN